MADDTKVFLISISPSLGVIQGGHMDMPGQKSPRAGLEQLEGTMIKDKEDGECKIPFRNASLLI